MFFFHVSAALVASHVIYVDTFEGNSLLKCYMQFFHNISRLNRVNSSNCALWLVVVLDPISKSILYSMIFLWYSMYNRVFNGDDMVYMTLLLGACGIVLMASRQRWKKSWGAQVLEVSPQRWLVVWCEFVEVVSLISEFQVVNIYIYTWNPNDPCFCWKRSLVFGVWKPFKNRGHWGSRYIYIWYDVVQASYPFEISTKTQIGK